MRVRKAFSTALAFLVGVFLFVSLPVGAQVTPIRPPQGPLLRPEALIGQIEVVFQVNLDELAKQLPEKLMLYQASSDPIALTQRQALERVFGKTAYFEAAEVSGGVFCADLTRLWAKAPAPGDRVRALSAQEIRAMAERFLEEIKGIPPEKIMVHTAADTIEFSDSKGQRQTLPVGFNMTYRRVLAGYEVVGPGGKTKVFLDLDGQAAGYLRVWRKLAPLREEPIINAYQAADNLRRDPLGNLLLADVKKVTVSEMRLAYFELGISERQRYLQPIYLFQCTAHVEADGKSSQIPYVRYMEALPQPPEALWPTGPTYEPGPRPQTRPKPGED